jgi:DNA-binding transcriptional LysR family regulator
MGSLPQIAAVRDGTLDAGILYDLHLEERDREVLDTALIGTGETMLAVHRNHPFANRLSVSMAELVDEPALWPERRVATRYFDRLMAACMECGGTPRIVQECTTNSILLSLVAVGMGIGFVTATPDAGPTGNIVLVPIEDLGLTFEVLLVWRKRDPSPALKRFISAMAESENAVAA